jgi:hypothetical protein
MSRRSGVARPITVFFSDAPPGTPHFRGWSLGASEVKVRIDPDFRWKGWEIVFFEYRAAKQVAAFMAYDLAPIIFDAESDSFFMFNENGELPTDAEYARLDDDMLWTEIQKETIETSAGPKDVWEFTGIMWDKVEVSPLNEARRRRMR